MDERAPKMGVSHNTQNYAIKQRLEPEPGFANMTERVGFGNFHEEDEECVIDRETELEVIYTLK